MSAEVVDLQGTDAWRKARAGIVTASRIPDVCAKIKSGEAAGRANYRAQIIAERLSGEPCEDGFESAAMRRGSEQEPFARAAYEVRSELLIEQVGLVLHPTIEGSGGSPDGLVGLEGGVEIKCPNTSNHISYLIKDEAPSKYYDQMQWLMACTGRAWWDFVSFDNRLPDELRLFVKRVPRDEAHIVALEGEVRRFLAEVDEVIEKLRGRGARS